MKRTIGLALSALFFSTVLNAQVDTSYVYNTSTPFGTLDIRIAKSASRYYYLQEGKTISFRESAPGVKTNTYRDMTSWDSSPYSQGNMREKNGTADYFIMNYRLLFPVNYNKDYSAGYPMIVMMHGAGERGNCWDNACYHATRSWNYSVNDPPAPKDSGHRLLNNDHNLLHGGKPHLDARNLAGARLPNDPSMPGRAFPGFVLFTQNLNGWVPSTVQDAIRVVRLVAKKYNVDPNRIYIHGLSNGGVGTYEAIKRAPWLFAAALPMSAPSESSCSSSTIVGRISHMPLWIFQGGQDTAPTPTTTERFIRRFRDAGMEVRYSLYPHLGHGTWNTAYGEAEFFKWMLSKSKTKIHVFADNAAICGSGGGVKMELGPGFHHYQWERNGVIISGATGATYTATSTGSYRARFSRVKNPTSAQWEAWSPAVTITEQNLPAPEVEQIGTLMLKDLNGYGNARLQAVGDYANYYWYKNGSPISMSTTTKSPVFLPGECTTTSCTGNGDYTLVVAGFDKCRSAPSKPKKIYFNNTAPINLTAPTNFSGAAVSGSSIKLTWGDASSGEIGFEIWRRQVTGASTYSQWVMPVLTGANATTFTDSGLQPSATYHYKVRAVSATGRSNYTPAASTSYLVVSTGGDTTPPTAPTNLAAQQSGINAIRLTWNASTDNSGIKEYVIYYNATFIATGSANTSFEIKNLSVNSNYSFTVKAKDLSNNLSAESNAATANTFVTGLYYEHTTGAWSDLDQINWNVAEFKGQVPNFTLAPRTQDDYFNFKFEGYLYISQAGTYQFQSISSDGSRVEINGAVVVENDGVHGTRTITGPTVSLSAGPKRITVKYFEFDGTHTLTVKYKGPDTNGSLINIPDGALRSSNTSSSAMLASHETDASREETIAVNELPETDVNVFPNPAPATNLNIQMDAISEAPVNVRVLDLNGRPYYNVTILADDIRNGLRITPDQSLGNGLYIIVVQQDETLIRKIIAVRN